MLDKKTPTVPFISILHRKHAKYLNKKVKDEDLSFGLFPLLITIYENEGICRCADSERRSGADPCGGGKCNHPGN